MKARPLIPLILGSFVTTSFGKPVDATFGDDVAFLKSHTAIHVLKDPDSGARVAVAPAWQGRVKQLPEPCDGKMWCGRLARMRAHKIAILLQT